MISRSSLNPMIQLNLKLGFEMHYGLSMMEVHFKEFYFLFNELSGMMDHVDATAVHAWTDPLTKTTIVMKAGNMNHMGKNFQTLITVVQLSEQELNKQK